MRVHPAHPAHPAAPLPPPARSHRAPGTGHRAPATGHRPPGTEGESSNGTTACDEAGHADVDSVAAFVTDYRQETLLRLRDDTPDIQWPPTGSSPADTASPARRRTAVRELRELREETGLDVPGLRPHHPGPLPGPDEDEDDAPARRPAFHAVVDVDPSEPVRGEGRALRLLPIAEAPGMRVPPDLDVHLRRLRSRLAAGAVAGAATGRGPATATATATGTGTGTGGNGDAASRAGAGA
ncbi:hypothetical protein [Kitasatospora sp. NPDC059599]|uniref:hypothetical protein n=1 Tax=Kitasatospora sp. NPDC059599 TaxID=3346880 RepID=UPI00369EBA1C